ncbi:MAG TPA: porin family protein [Gemmatimonadales bacterium]|nr:porin family protein [Gemmatimonadales bacterium]
MTRSQRSTLLAIALALPVAPLVAQGSPMFGLLGGITSGKVTVQGDDVGLTLGSRTGFAGGVSMRFPVGTMASIEIDGMYAQKGTKITGDGESAELKLGYIEVPVVLRYELGDASTHPFVLAGASVSLKAGCDVTAKSSGISAGFDCDDLFEGKQKSVDAGLTVGAGVAVNRFSVQARYTHGMMELFDDNDNSVTTKNRALFFLAGISF